MCFMWGNAEQCVGIHLVRKMLKHNGPQESLRSTVRMLMSMFYGYGLRKKSKMFIKTDILEQLSCSTSTPLTPDNNNLQLNMRKTKASLSLSLRILTLFLCSPPLRLFPSVLFSSVSSCLSLSCLTLSLSFYHSLS